MAIRNKKKQNHAFFLWYLERDPGLKKPVKTRDYSNSKKTFMRRPEKQNKKRKSTAQTKHERNV